MWKAYTRESPARRGWSLGANIIGFLAVLGLAQLTVNYRHAHGVDEDQATRNSPLRISLPDVFRWSVRSFPSKPLEAIRPTGTIVYHGEGDEQGSCELTIQWFVAERNLSLDDLAEKIAEINPDEALEVPFGTSRGLMEVVSAGKRKTEIAGICQFEDGPVVMIRYSGIGQAQHKEIFRSICRSIQPRHVDTSLFEHDSDDV